MTLGRASPFGIGMPLRIFAITLLFVAGCSWLTARAHNNPRVGCERTLGRTDAVLSIIGAAGFATSVYFFGKPPEEAHTAGNPLFVVTALPSLTLALVEVLQASYGLAVADRCEAERAKITSDG